MKVSFILNGEDVEVVCDADARISDVLREQFGLLSVKTGCNAGMCGSCSVLLDGKQVPSCMLPVFKVRGRELVTLEAFSTTDEYNDIVSGFKQADLQLCGFCTAAVIFSCEALLERISQPNKNDITSAFTGVVCRCIQSENLFEAVIAAAEYRRRRMYGRTN